MPLVTPLDSSHNKETQELANFYNETLGFCP
ncbi:MAG: carboxymuconolactone decarboxylase family protein, partial [Nonlabens sp.]|nr:carboxymuconolactone decarboxylase family protein [Nonlabens sp.]